MESDSTHSTNSSHSTHSPEAGNEIVAAEASEQPGVDEHTGEAPSPRPTAMAATRSSKHKGKKKLVSSVKRKREKKMKGERSSVWEHFTKFDQPLVEIVDGKETVVGNTKRAQCKYCPTHLACDSRENGTSSLRKHIELVCKGYPGRNNLEESQQILSSDVLDQKSTLVSRQWSEEACLEAACVMIVLDELPFSAIERPGFRHFCKVAVPRWDVPCRKVVVKNFLRMYDAKKETLKRELRGHSVCLTTDTWTSCQNINYMVVTAHFIDSGWNMHKRVLNFCVVPNHTGITIGKILESCLIQWNLDRVLTISVDNASANKVAIEYLQKKMSGWPRKPLFDGKFMHVRCLAHIVNIIVRSGLHIMDRSVASIRNAVRYVRSSGQRLDVFKLCAEKEILDCSKVCVLDVPTRWNSTFIMLDTALELKKAFDRMADEEDAKYRSYFDEEDDLHEELDEAENIRAARHSRKRVGPPVESDWEKAAVFVKFLKVFYDVTVEVSAQLKPTAHKAFHDIVTIREELDQLFHKPIDNQSTESDKILFGMANKMRNKFQKYFGSIEDINQLFLVALVLDPRYKLKNVERVCEMYLAMDSVEIKKKSDALKQLVVTLCDIYACSSGGNSAVGAQSTAQKKKQGSSNATATPRPKGHKGGVRAAMLADWNKQLEGEAVVVGGEVDRYLLDPIEKPGDDENWKILDWWKLNGDKYPNLQAVAKDVLAIQVSTVASESSFSTGKRVIDPHRSSLTPRTVEALICLQNWLKSDAIMGLEYIPTIEEMAFFEEVEKEQADEDRKAKEQAAALAEQTAATQQSKKATKVSKVSKASDASKSSKTGNTNKKK